MFDAVTLSRDSSVLEIGCGDGFLTRAIVRHPCARVWVYEIDDEWATYVKKAISDPRLTIFTENFLDVDLHILQPYAPWAVLANLPYQVTFPILHRFSRISPAFCPGCGDGARRSSAENCKNIRAAAMDFLRFFFNIISNGSSLIKCRRPLFIRHKSLLSRLLYFKTIANPQPIPREDEFWQFVKKCFAQPRRTLRNNLKGTPYKEEHIPEKTTHLRAQQMKMEIFLAMWQQCMRS